MRTLFIMFAIGCHPAPSAPPEHRPEPPPAPAPEAPPPAGNGSTGSFSTGSGTSPAQGSAATIAECAKQRCGPALGLMTKVCSDGSTGGPTGRCLEHADHTCGWELRACP
ncbi:MAG: hypothetical protein ABI678_28445 [Kofleriaceae bacterium]